MLKISSNSVLIVKFGTAYAVRQAKQKLEYKFEVCISQDTQNKKALDS